MNHLSLKKNKWAANFLGMVCLSLITIASGNGFAASPDASQELFSSPQSAIQALLKAVQSQDQTSLLQIFGPDSKDLLGSGDPVEAKHSMEAFARQMTEMANPSPVDATHSILFVGKEHWPFPIPLEKQKGKWVFATAVGKEELINRRIGKNELNAIALCRDYVQAQLEFSKQHGGKEYAENLISSPGKKDGLYWTSPNEKKSSPMAAIGEKAKSEGYTQSEIGTGNDVGPYLGYFFKILNGQGDKASGGKMDYLKGGKLKKGFGMVAFPAEWNSSGVMTFLVNQDGKVFQKNLGEKTMEIAKGMTEYDPDQSWQAVQ